MSTDIIAAKQAQSVSVQRPDALDESQQLLDRVRLAAASRVGSRSGLPTVFCYAVSDLLSIALALGTVRVILAVTGIATEFRQFDIRLALGFVAATLIVNWYQGLYSTVVVRPAAELRLICISSLGLAAFFVALQWMMELPLTSLLVWLAISAIAVAIVLPVMRAACRLAFGRSRWWGRRVLLVGCGEKSPDMYRTLRKSSVYGLRPVGFVEDFDQLSEDADAEGYLGPLAELVERIEDCDVSLAMVASNGVGPRNEIVHLVCRPNTGIMDWLIVSDCAGLPCLWTSAREVAGMPAVGLSNRLRCPWRRALKRAFDLAIVSAASLVLVPLIGLLALFIRFVSPGASPFFASERIGRDGKRFLMWKLRTMVPNAEAVLKECLARDPALRAEYERDHKLKNDPRLIWMGKLIRKASLDELPQIWNIIIGEMSVVGPRPMLVNELEKYGDTYEEYRLVKPGITGMWQVNGRNNTSYAERLKYTDYYVKNWSLWLDLYILFCTVKVVVLREGAY